MNKLDEEKIVRKYAKLVRTKARSFYLAGAEQEDVIQEGMIGLLNAVRNYNNQKEVSFDIYAGLCIKRQILNAIRMAANQKNSLLTSAISLDDIFPSGKIFEEENPEDEAIKNEEIKRLKTKITKLLSPLEKKVLQGYLDGKSYEDIGVHLGCEKKSVDNAIQRIRKKLSGV